jgi:hypothetical protein
LPAASPMRSIPCSRAIRGGGPPFRSWRGWLHTAAGAPAEAQPALTRMRLSRQRLTEAQPVLLMFHCNHAREEDAPRNPAFHQPHAPGPRGHRHPWRSAAL